MNIKQVAIDFAKYCNSPILDEYYDEAFDRFIEEYEDIEEEPEVIEDLVTDNILLNDEVNRINQDIDRLFGIMGLIRRDYEAF
jgi:Mg2+ and Co2+ transporter CorA